MIFNFIFTFIFSLNCYCSKHTSYRKIKPKRTQPITSTNLINHHKILNTKLKDNLQQHLNLQKQIVDYRKSQDLNYLCNLKKYTLLFQKRDLFNEEYKMYSPAFLELMNIIFSTTYILPGSQLLNILEKLNCCPFKPFSEKEISIFMTIIKTQSTNVKFYEILLILLECKFRKLLHSKYNETYKNEDSSSKNSFVEKVCFSNSEEKFIYAHLHFFLFRALNCFPNHNYTFTYTGKVLTYISKPALRPEEYQDLVFLMHGLGCEIPFDDAFFELKCFSRLLNLVNKTINN
ncbi:hypothetical protein EHP00_1139 [Ecytonucleospora hepatopenaei]|uniref:Uncharacterized protein n=1 Tax=Ecytonucleospora hepatopenaei TaxID=646526 RepID=A0A1W0E4I5_9MICR|nr:hypothetical protein EHP00_1139 [Ecytonucleospora hepatopenaei]